MSSLSRRALNASDLALALEQKLRQALLELRSSQQQLAVERRGRDEATAKARNAEARAETAEAEGKRARQAEKQRIDEALAELSKARERATRCTAEVRATVGAPVGVAARATRYDPPWVHPVWSTSGIAVPYGTAA